MHSFDLKIYRHVDILMSNKNTHTNHIIIPTIGIIIIIIYSVIIFVILYLEFIIITIKFLLSFRAF